MYAMDTPPPATIILIVNSDVYFQYAVSSLRNRRYEVVTITPSMACGTAKCRAPFMLDWDRMVDKSTSNPACTVNGVIASGDASTKLPLLCDPLAEHRQGAIRRVIGQAPRDYREFGTQVDVNPAARNPGSNHFLEDHDLSLGDVGIVTELEENSPSSDTVVSTEIDQKSVEQPLLHDMLDDDRLPSSGNVKLGISKTYVTVPKNDHQWEQTYILDPSKDVGDVCHYPYLFTHELIVVQRNCCRRGRCLRRPCLRQQVHALIRHRLV